MARLVWTERGLADLAAVHEHIRRDSPMYARRTLAKIRQTAKQLKDFPRRGWEVEQYGREDIREILAHQYRIVYRLVGESCYVVAVAHGSRGSPLRLDPDDLESPN